MKQDNSTRAGKQGARASASGKRPPAAEASLPPQEVLTLRSRVRAWLRRSWPAILILLLGLGIFTYLLLHANRGRIFRPDRTESSLITTERAEVVNVSVSHLSLVRSNPEHKQSGTQTYLLRMLTGSHKGETYELKNVMVGIYTGTEVSEGDRVTVYQRVEEDTGALAEVALYQYDRTPGVYLILGLFLLVVLLVGGKTGAKSLLGLGLTVIALIWIFCPMWMKGADPIWLSFGLCVLVCVLSFVILGGTGKKILCAILGTVAGMGLAALFGELAQVVCRINGYSIYESNAAIADLVNLQDLDFPLCINGLITAGVIIASLGAVMDVAMSLSSAVCELKAVNPQLTVADLWRSSMNIGRDMVGTMTNTLILAFVGSSLILVIRLWTQGPSYRMLLSSQFLSVELIPAIASSIGVILAVPVTGIIAALFFGEKKRKAAKS